MGCARSEEILLLNLFDGPRVEVGESRSGQESATCVEPEQDSDVALVRRAARGDVEAYERLYRRHADRVMGLCVRMTRDRREAEELVQDVFVRVWEKLGSFQGRSAFSTWLHRVTVNTVIERLRGQRRWRERHDGAADPDAAPDTAFARAAGADVDLERAIARLPEQARMVFLLHDVDGHKHREIAEMTGLAVGTSKAHLHRARGLLRGMLAQEAGGIA